MKFFLVCLIVVYLTEHVCSSESLKLHRLNHDCGVPQELCDLLDEIHKLKHNISDESYHGSFESWKDVEEAINHDGEWLRERLEDLLRKDRVEPIPESQNDDFLTARRYTDNLRDYTAQEKQRMADTVADNLQWLKMRNNNAMQKARELKEELKWLRARPYAIMLSRLGHELAAKYHALDAGVSIEDILDVAYRSTENVTSLVAFLNELKSTEQFLRGYDHLVSWNRSELSSDMATIKYHFMIGSRKHPRDMLGGRDLSGVDHGTVDLWLKDLQNGFSATNSYILEHRDVFRHHIPTLIRKSIVNNDHTPMMKLIDTFETVAEKVIGYKTILDMKFNFDMYCTHFGYVIKETMSAVRNDSDEMKSLEEIRNGLSAEIQTLIWADKLNIQWNGNSTEAKKPDGIKYLLQARDDQKIKIVDENHQSWKSPDVSKWFKAETHDRGLSFVFTTVPQGVVLYFDGTANDNEASRGKINNTNDWTKNLYPYPIDKDCTTFRFGITKIEAENNALNISESSQDWMFGIDCDKIRCRWTKWNFVVVKEKGK